MTGNPIAIIGSAHRLGIGNPAPFCPSFFNLSYDEALVDPHNKLLLLCTYEALESACIPPSGIPTGPATDYGVYITMLNSDLYVIPSAEEKHNRELQSNSVAAGCPPAAFTSYYFGFRGPSLTLHGDIASLDGIELACQSLKAGVCKIAVVGSLEKSDGEEAAWVLVLKRLEFALQDGDPVIGVLRECGDGAAQEAALNGTMDQRAVYTATGLVEGLISKMGSTGVLLVGQAANMSLEYCLRAPKDKSVEMPSNLLLLSAKTTESLKKMADSYADILENWSHCNLLDLLYTSARWKDVFQHRAAIVGNDVHEIIQNLRNGNFACKKVDHNEVSKKVYLMVHPIQDDAKNDVANAILELCKSYPAFKSEFEKYSLLAPPSEHPCNQSLLYQICTFKLLNSLGLNQTAVTSQDELLGACVTGLMDLPTAVEIMSEKQKILSSLNYVDGSSFYITADNKLAVGPKDDAGLGTAVTPREAIQSGLLDTHLANYKKITQKIKYLKPSIPFVAYGTGRKVLRFPPNNWLTYLFETGTEGKVIGVMRGTVCFSIGLVKDMGQLKFEFETERAQLVECAGVGLKSLFAGFGGLFLEGVGLDWEKVYRGGAKVQVPTYPF